ncbi:hypothetical protein M0R45_007006 [Rubus argutus]|uniref:Uncharacterized protein n=1 Tax=Rubus argutus TaxID=59490 RepID=A0AAW1YSL9_RUBAR
MLFNGGAISITEQKRERSFHLSIGLGCVSWLIDQLQEIRKANEQTLFKKFTGDFNSYQFWLERHNNKGGSFLRLSKCVGGFVKTIILPKGRDVVGWRLMEDNLVAIAYGVLKNSLRFESAKVNSLQFEPMNAELKLNFK